MFCNFLYAKGFNDCAYWTVALSIKIEFNISLSLPPESFLCNFKMTFSFFVVNLWMLKWFPKKSYLLLFVFILLYRSRASRGRLKGWQKGSTKSILNFCILLPVNIFCYLNKFFLFVLDFRIHQKQLGVRDSGSQNKFANYEQASHVNTYYRLNDT